MLRMKEVYAIPDRHIRYARYKSIFQAQDDWRIFCANSWGQDAIPRGEARKPQNDNDMYNDLILQSLPPSYNPFIINHNMNGLKKSISELINMLV